MPIAESLISAFLSHQFQKERAEEENKQRQQAQQQQQQARLQQALMMSEVIGQQQEQRAKESQANREFTYKLATEDRKHATETALANKRLDVDTALKTHKMMLDYQSGIHEKQADVALERAKGLAEFKGEIKPAKPIPNVMAQQLDTGMDIMDRIKDVKEAAKKVMGKGMPPMLMQFLTTSPGQYAIGMGTETLNKALKARGMGQVDDDTMDFVAKFNGLMTQFKGLTGFSRPNVVELSRIYRFIGQPAGGEQFLKKLDVAHATVKRGMGGIAQRRQAQGFDISGYEDLLKEAVPQGAEPAPAQPSLADLLGQAGVFMQPKQ